MSKIILVTGGLGFIGSRVISHLLKTTDYHFIILDKETYAGRRENLPRDILAKQRIRIITGDVTKRKDVEKAIKKANIVIHMAADTHTSRSLQTARKTMITNVIGTTIVLESAAKYSIEKFLFLSSSEVYGDQKNTIPMDEDHPLAPATPYAVSKLAGERLAYSFYLTKKVPVVILRLFNAYGPRQHIEKMFPRFITNLLQNKQIILHHGGKQKRDWVYVTDHARAIEKVLQMPQKKVVGEVFNFGTQTSLSVAEIAKKILQELQKDSSLITIQPASQKGTMSNVGISKKAKHLLNWQPEISLEEGIKKTVAWYKKNQDWWKEKQ